MKKSQKLYLPLKRLIGIVGSLIGIIFCLTLFWWWIFPINLIVTKGHPIFVQERYGKNESKFNILKFRSMRIDVDPNSAPYHMDQNEQKSMETRFGRFLRKTSLDETPQLFNIFIGQMAFIGPRPGSTHKEEYLREFRNEFTPSAFLVKPGLSGYAQVKIKRDHDPKQKAYYDHLYVKNLSFFLDLKIFFCTIFSVFKDLKGR